MNKMNFRGINWREKTPTQFGLNGIAFLGSGLGQEIPPPPLTIRPCFAYQQFITLLKRRRWHLKIVGKTADRPSVIVETRDLRLLCTPWQRKNLVNKILE